MQTPAADAGADTALAEGPRSVSREERTEITALLVGAALLRIGAAGGTVAVQLYLTDLAGGEPHGVQIGVVGAAQAGSEMLFALFLARFADRFGRTRFLIGGPFIGMLAMALVALCDQPLQIAGVRLIEGIGAAAFVPTALGTIAAATSHDTRARARASGAFEGSTLVGYAGGFLIGGFAYHGLHRGAFVLLAAFYLAAALVCLRFVPHVAPLPVSPVGHVARTILGPGPIRVFIPAWLAVNGLVGAWLQNLPSLLKRNADTHQTLVHHFDERLISAMLDAWAALLVLGIVLWTPSLHRNGAARTMRRAVPGTFLLVGTLFLMNHLPLVWSAPLLLPLVAAVLLQSGFGPAAVAYLADLSESLVADRSALMAFYTVTLAGGGALGALIGGAFQSWLRLDGLLLLGLLLGILAYASLTRVLRYERARPQPQSTAPPAASWRRA